MASPKRPRVGPGEIFVVIAIVLIALIVITNNYRLIVGKVADMLYSGTSAIVALVMLVEYLLLKGADRSDIYQRELEAARQKRREDLLALREMETQLIELRARLAAAAPDLATSAASPDAVPQPAAATLQVRLDDAREIVEGVLRQLRQRI